jgi:ketosteroid isomerase-like protein
VRGIRVLYEALNRREVDVMLARCHPRVEAHIARIQTQLDLEPVYYTREGLARAVEIWLDAWEGFWVEPIELIDLGDRIVVLSRQTGRGRASGAEVEMQHAAVITFAHGWAVRLQFYWDWEEATHAVSG